MNPLDELISRIGEAHLLTNKRSYQRSTFLVEPGQKDTNLYLIENGSVRIYFEDGEEEQIIRLGYGGDMIGALDSFITDGPTKLFIQTLKQTDLIALTKKSFLNFIESDISHFKLWNACLQLLFLDQLEREQDLLTQSPRERYLRVLKRSPRLFQEVPHKYIASYLRMTPETLSRLKKS